MKISINLLPPELTAQKKKSVKFIKIQFIGISIVLVMIFLSSLTLALRILQNRNISLYQARVAGAEQRVSDLKNTQASLTLLKNRLQVIDQYLGVASKQTSIYQLVDKLLPQSAVVSSISVDQTGGVTFVAVLPDNSALESLVTNLTDTEENKEKFSQVTIESLNRDKQGLYRTSLRIKAI
ncbi:hypothetical protein HYS95_00590 [Candidatus Daviesbacteria bacterium]|nr:hypothetical protein [Candidatus Daviesbacteria bacterium]